MNLREVFVSLALKSGDAKKDLKDILNLADKTADGLKDVDESAEEAGESLEDAAEKGKSAWKDFGETHKRVVDAFGKTKDFREWGKGVAGGIAIGAAALVGFAGLAGKFVADWAHGAGQIEATAKQFGISAQSLQEWQYAAKVTGGEAEGIAGIFKELELRLGEVGNTGTGSAADALTLLKLRVDDLRRLRPEQQMEVIADRLSMISDIGSRAFIKDSLFGGEYEKVGTLLEQGSAGIATLRKEAQALGGVLDGEALKGAKDFNREVAKADALASSLKSTVAQALLPVIREWITRGSEWVRNNRELIATKVDEWARRLGTFLGEALPAAGKLLDLVMQFVDQLGGMDDALKLAATGWAAWQLAGLAAINTVGAALAVFLASFAAGMALVDRFKGGPESRARNARDAGELGKFKAATDLLQANAADSGDPTVERAKRLLTAELESLRMIKGSGVGSTRSRQLQASIDEQAQAVERAKAALEAAIAESDAALTMTPDGIPLGKIKKPGGTAPTTADSLLREQRKREADLERLRKIRADLEGRRMNASGAERLTIERTLAGVNKQLTGVDGLKSPNELIAELMGQGTHLGAGAMKPTGLGTSINQIDARIIFTMGDIEVEMPSSAIDPNNPRGSGEQFGDGIWSKLSQYINTTYQQQRSQING